jgi:hypothetical protein
MSEMKYAVFAIPRVGAGRTSKEQEQPIDRRHNRTQNDFNQRALTTYISFPRLGQRTEECKNVCMTLSVKLD